jgi:hypothetical protein
MFQLKQQTSAFHFNSYTKQSPYVAAYVMQSISIKCVN